MNTQYPASTSAQTRTRGPSTRHRPATRLNAATGQTSHPGNPIPVIILTTFEEPALFEQAVAAGARGFLRKDVSPEELLAAIESVHAGQTAYAPTASQAVRNAVQFTTPAGGADVPTLTERERSILRLMAGGYANREIASMLFLAEGTVKNYVSGVLDKLQVRDRTQAVLKAISLRLI